MNSSQGVEEQEEEGGIVVERGKWSDSQWTKGEEGDRTLHHVMSFHRNRRHHVTFSFKENGTGVSYPKCRTYSERPPQ